MTEYSNFNTNFHSFFHLSVSSLFAWRRKAVLYFIKVTTLPIAFFASLLNAQRDHNVVPQSGIKLAENPNLVTNSVFFVAVLYFHVLVKELNCKEGLQKMDAIL